jgi:methionyl-tRNA formyltransferase
VSIGRIAIATPHARHDLLEAGLRQRMPATQLVRLRSPEELLRFAKEGRADYIFFPHWSWKIPKSVYETFECVMFHMTDLPFGRGGSPLQNLIVRGHHETMLTAFRCGPGIDVGPIYAKTPLSLEGSAEEILNRASALMEPMIADIANTRPEPRPQVGEPTPFARRKPEQGDLSVLASLREVHDYIRMLDAVGYPPAFVDSGIFRLEFAQSTLGDGQVEARVRFTVRQDG